MKNSKANIRIISLILAVVMCLGIFVGCVPNIDNGDNTGNNGNTNQGNNDSNDNGSNDDANVGGEGNENNPDEPHTCSFGDWTVIKSATATEDGLCERYCKCGKVEQKVIPASAKEYTITYIDAPQHNNPTKYTVNDFIDLQSAVWNGLSFAYWSDKDGNIIEEIPYGTEGNITLYANWRLMENSVESYKENKRIVFVFDEEANRYFFVYEIGSIHNVVLDELAFYRYHGATSHTWSISETVSFTESNAQNVSSTVSKSVTSGSSWSSAVADASHNSTSNNITHSGKVSTEINAGGWAKVGGEIGNSKGKTTENGTTYTTTENKGGSSSSSSSTSQSVSSTISFITDTSTQITRSETLNPGDSPAGLYTYVQAGTICIYAIVIYDVETKDFNINIYSDFDSVYDTMLYEPTSEYNPEIRLVDHDPFKFNVDINGLAEEIENAYYIDYDANGGEGTMSTQMVLPNESTKLLANKFTKEGSLFVGWRVKDGDKTVIYTDEQSVKNLGSPKETITLEAIWTSDPEYDKDVVYTLTTKSGTVSQYTAGVRPGIDYSAKIEYRNRTADSVEIRITWTATRTNGWTSYGQNVKLSVGSVTSGTIQLVSFNGWGQYSSNKTSTKDTGWMTVSLDTSEATTIGLKVQYWQTNSSGSDMSNSSDPTKAINTTWTIEIPAAK